MKKYVGLVFISGLILSGCSSNDNNPFKTMSNDRIGKFLVKASVYAEKQLNLPKALHKRAYLRCMQGAESNSTCENVYKAMIEYAHSDLDFKALTVSELKEMKYSAQWKDLREEYDAAVFDSLD